VIKGEGQPSAILRAVVREIRSVGAPVGVTRAMLLEEAFSELLRRRAFSAWLFGGFSASALAIVGCGILGLVAMSTANRTRELGIRLALGATRDGVIRMLLREQLTGVLGGLALGAILAAWAMQFMRLSLYEFTAYDPRLWAIAMVTIVVTATVGVLVPALRASRIDPVKALRVD